MTTRILKLRHVCVIEKGGLNPQNHAEEYFAHYSIPAFDDGLGPVLEQGSGIKSQKTVISRGTVLVSKLNPRIPRVWFVNDEQPRRRICSSEFVPFLPDPEKLHPEYLAFALRRLLAGGQITGSTSAATKSRERAKPTEIAELEIPVPPLTEQRRVVDLLSRAEGIVRLRREAQAKAAEIIPALFLDMFGDPATNPNGLTARRVRDFVARFEGGKNLLASDEGSTRFRILKVSAVTTGRYVEPESKPTPVNYEPPENHIVRVGDMLFSRANTQELVGATAIVDATDGRTLLPDKLWRIVWAEDVDQHYMHALFQNRYVRKELGRLSSGTSASMRNISQEKLFALSLPIAPLASQLVFGKHAEAMKSVLAQQEAAAQYAEAAFRSLLARVFATEEQCEAQDTAEAAVA